MSTADWIPIPGETPIDISRLKVKGIGNRSQLSVVEAENIRKAFAKYLSAKPNRRTAPFTYEWCLHLHEEMFGDVWEWAGEIRTRDVGIGIEFYKIRESFVALLGDLESWPGYGMDFVEQAACLHHRAVQIHPFFNGNGRWARLLANVWLKLHGRAPILWPENTIGDTSTIRGEYIAAIKAADSGDQAPLIELHRRYAPPSAE